MWQYAWSSFEMRSSIKYTALRGLSKLYQIFIGARCINYIFACCVAYHARIFCNDKMNPDVVRGCGKIRNDTNASMIPFHTHSMFIYEFVGKRHNFLKPIKQNNEEENEKERKRKSINWRVTVNQSWFKWLCEHWDESDENVCVFDSLWRFSSTKIEWFSFACSRLYISVLYSFTFETNFGAFSSYRQ